MAPSREAVARLPHSKYSTSGSSVPPASIASSGRLCRPFHSRANSSSAARARRVFFLFTCFVDVKEHSQLQGRTREQQSRYMRHDDYTGAAWVDAI